MNQTMILGVLLGACLSSGILVIWSAARRNQPSLNTRLIPYLSDQLVENPRLVAPSFRQKLLAPIWHFLDLLLHKLGSTNHSVKSRLSQAGWHWQLRSFRYLQVGSAIAGLALSSLLIFLLLVVRSVSIPITILIMLFGTFFGVIMPDQLLSARAKKRQAQINLSVPDAAELIALTVAAGEGIVSAMGRVCEMTVGPLGQELKLTVNRILAGGRIEAELRNLGSRNSAPALLRLCDSLVIALDRGTPLAQVLRSQAMDSREQARRELIEAGGRREIAMLVPVVFLILPITVLFALYPGLIALKIGF
ncbi:hypothetical protein BK816_02615 [Boudabousia tangfeifanii]|uniref:Type II secretion system protein GspF domain-containing protein n=1 Tax=Boudabousia tangfeifanii TaxID=1912795 RepID=A0A1D9MJE2_9ACTO|nr:type II secretion system F family protein [Boudabousia tangfeifanii]AOZ72328.1 hypothetical protein BK816_02615 [Boudabousia tangfeifanii]